MQIETSLKLEGPLWFAKNTCFIKTAHLVLVLLVEFFESIVLCDIQGRLRVREARCPVVTRREVLVEAHLRRLRRLIGVF